MKEHLLTYLESFILLLILTVVFITPLLFLGMTTEYFEIPKLIFIFFSTFILFGLWIITWILKGKITIRKSPVNITFILLLVAVLLSSVFSSSRYISIFGRLPDVHGSAVSWATYILLFFVIVNNLKERSYVRVLLQVLVASATLISLITLLSFFKLYLPFDIAKVSNFTPTGSIFSTTFLLITLLPLLFISTVKHSKFIPSPVAMVLSLLFSLTIVLVGTSTTYILFFIVFIVSIYFVKDQLNETTLPMLLTPFGLTALTLMLILIPFSGNKLRQAKLDFPKEVQLPLGVSWELSVASFARSPAFGTGPSTYLYNFNEFKPVEFNNSVNWNNKFSKARNELLQVLGEWGFVGIVAILFVLVKIVTAVVRYLRYPKYYELDDSDQVIFPSLTISICLVVVFLIIHASTLVSVTTSLILLASFLSLSYTEKDKVIKLPERFNLEFSGKKIDPLPIFLITFYFVLLVFVGSKAVRAVSADYYHRLALRQVDRDGGKAYEYLQKAEKLNPYIDLYRVDMAQINLVLATVLITQKGPTEVNPEGNLTEEDLRNIQLLLSQAVNEAKVATTLAPRSARNWEVLGSIYKSIGGTSDASLALSLDAYGRAIKNDPYNPTLRLIVGSIYYAAGNYEKAIAFYEDAINLKPGLVSAYYNLAIALRDGGDLQGSKEAAEKAVELLKDQLNADQKAKVTELMKETWIEDINLATELLKEIEGSVNSENTLSPDSNNELQESVIPDLNLELSTPSANLQ